MPNGHTADMLTAMAASDVLGVPAAFSFIGQDMILNVAALSAIASHPASSSGWR